VFFRAKGAALEVLAELGYAASFRPGSGEPFLHPGASGELHVATEPVAVVGELHPESAAAFGIEATTALLVLDLGALRRGPRPPGAPAPASPAPHGRGALCRS